jgi:hypothetical protein
MSVNMVETAEMETENAENQTSDNLTTAQENAPAEGVELTDSFSSELMQPIWSVVSYEEVAVSSLNYDEAVKWVEKLKTQNISGLCIVTDEAARRISN